MAQVSTALFMSLNQASWCIGLRVIGVYRGIGVLLVLTEGPYERVRHGHGRLPAWILGLSMLNFSCSVLPVFGIALLGIGVLGNGSAVKALMLNSAKVKEFDRGASASAVIPESAI